jgi:hypothetical protein
VATCAPAADLELELADLARQLCVDSSSIVPRPRISPRFVCALQLATTCSLCPACVRGSSGVVAGALRQTLHQHCGVWPTYTLPATLAVEHRSHRIALTPTVYVVRVSAHTQLKGEQGASPKLDVDASEVGMTANGPYTYMRTADGPYLVLHT